MQSTTARVAARPSAYLLAALVAGLALGSVNRAFAVGTNPNAALIRYTLAAGIENKIELPVFNQPVHVMAVCETFGDRGVAIAEVIKATPSGFLMWTGQNANTLDSSYSGLNTHGYSGIDESIIARVSFSQQVELEVQNTTAMAISNESASTRSGYVTLLW